MRNSTKKLLFLLYGAEITQPVYLPVTELAFVLPEQTAEGRRSLIYLLKSQKYLEQMGQGSQSLLYLTDLGRRSLEKEMAIFRLGRDWDGEWEVIVFRQGPDRDKNFHYLRAEIVKNGGLGLSRGVYAFPAEVPVALRLKCGDAYAANVCLFRTTEWSVGRPKDIAITHFSLTDLSRAYSGISSELDGLLIGMSTDKRLNYQYKYALHSLYERFFANVCEDTGLVGYYFTQTPHYLHILNRLQRAIATDLPE